MNNVTTWIYDALGRVKQEINQLGASRYFEYDAAGRLDKRTDRLGRVIEFDYNTLDQVTEERWKVGTELVRTLTHEYDDAGQLELAATRLPRTTMCRIGWGGSRARRKRSPGSLRPFNMSVATTRLAAGIA